MEKIIAPVSEGQNSRSSKSEFLLNADMLPWKQEKYSQPKFLINYQERAWNAFQSLAMPTISNETWRRTSLRNLKVDSLLLCGDKSVKKYSAPPRKFLFVSKHEEDNRQIVLFPDGSTNSTINDRLVKKGIVFTDLKTARSKYPDLLAHIMGQIVSPDESKFAALTSAFSRAGMLLYVPRNVYLDKPIRSIYWASGNHVIQCSHYMIWLDEGASVTFINESASNDENDGQMLHSGIVEVLLGEGARLKFVELQSWGNHVWNFSHERIRLGKDANLDWILSGLGSRLTKSFLDIDLTGEGASARMSGFYFTDRKQHLDYDTQQNHMAPHTTSDLLFKGVLKDQSRAIWQGMIYVASDAQKTDGYQANRNIILSPHARADSIPGLEILANDVRCTHGVTVGKVDPDQIFYLRSRGIDKNQAVNLLVEGFFDPIMQKIPVEDVKNRLKDVIHSKMD